MASRPSISGGEVAAAAAKLCDRTADTMERPGLPGLALGVLFDGEVMAAEGFGVRSLGDDAAVDAATVFQLASIPKSLAGSVLAALVDEKAFGWKDPVRTGNAEFALSDPWVSQHVTYADLFSHRSGVPKHAGDLLEDLGHCRETVIERLRLYPLGPFRLQHAYGNFVHRGRRRRCRPSRPGMGGRVAPAALRAAGHVEYRLDVRRVHGPPKPGDSARPSGWHMDHHGLSTASRTPVARGRRLEHGERHAALAGDGDGGRGGGRRNDRRPRKRSPRHGFHR